MQLRSRPNPTRRLFLKSSAGLVLAPALIGCHGGSPAHAAGSTRDLGPQFRLQPAEVWRFDNEAYRFKFSPNGDFVALISRRDIHVLEFPTGRPVARIAESRIEDLSVFCFGFESRTIITLRRRPERNGPTHPEMIQVFETASGRLLDRIVPPPLEAKAAPWSSDAVSSPDGAFLAVKMRDFFMFLNQPPSRETALVLLNTRDFSVVGILYESAPQRSFGLHAGRMTLSNSLMLAVEELESSRLRANAPSLIAIYDPRSAERIAAFSGTRQGAATIAWSLDGSLLAIGSEPLPPPGYVPTPDSMEVRFPETVRDAAWVWELRGRQTMISFPRIHSPVRSIAISPDNRWLATTRAKYSRQLGSGLSVWRLSDGAEMFAYETPDSRVINEVAFSPSGAHFAFTDGNEFKIFRVVA